MLWRQSEKTMPEDGEEIPIAILTPQEDILLAAPSSPVQTLVMRPDAREYRTLHSLPPVQTTELNVIRRLCITIHNTSEEEIIAVRLRGKEETLIERVFSLSQWETLRYEERELILPEAPKYAQAKTNKGATYAIVILAIIYSPLHATLADFVPFML